MKTETGNIKESIEKPKMEPIAVKLQNDVIEWINQNDELITDERDLQVRLAIFLNAKGYEKVYTEYRIPIQVLVQRMGWDENVKDRGVEFPWDNDISVDIVVGLDGRFACLELKYPTVSIEYDDEIFGEPLGCKDVSIIKSQGATNMVMYNYWKDVRRIEALSAAFPKVCGGVALIVTNNHIYWNGVSGNPKYKAFSTSSGVTIEGSLQWGEGAEMEETHPNMRLDGTYECHWHDTVIPYLTKSKSKTKDKFRYMLNRIEPVHSLK